MKRRTFAVPLVIALSLAFFGLLAQGAVPDVPTGQWLPGPALAQPRAGAVSVALDDGRVLVIGGRTSQGPVDTVEVLNADGSIGVVAPMLARRAGHAAAKLPDGRILVVGGTTLVTSDTENGPVTSEAVTNSAEIFDSFANVWYPAASLAMGRSGHTATAIADGRVLVAGGTGQDGAALDSFEVFDAETGQFASAGLLSAPRAEHAAAAAGTAWVVVAGGRNGTGVLGTADVIDLESGTVSSVVLNSPRAGASATTLLDGKILVAGGSNGATHLASAEVIDPVTGVSMPTGSMSQARSRHQALLLNHNNAVLVTGGTSNGAVVASAEQFVPWRGEFSIIGSPAISRTSAVVSNLSKEGVAWLAAGRTNDGNATADTELYGFATLKTDKDDYPPGTPVVVTGSGWQPGAVTLVLHEVGTGHPDRTYSAVADGSGSFQNTDFVPDTSHIGVRFYLTARAGGDEAQTTFTDASSIKVKNGAAGLSITSPTGAIDGTVNTSQAFVLQAIINSSPGVSWSNVTVTLTVPAGWTKSANPAMFSLAPGSDSALTWNVTPPAVAASNASLIVNVSGTPSSGGCSGQQSNDCSDSKDLKVDVVNPASLTINGFTAQETGQPPSDTIVNTGGSVTVNFGVLNNASAPGASASVSAPVLGLTTLTGTASAVCGAGTPSQHGVARGQNRTFTYTCFASGSGTLKFTGAASGTDENTGAVVTTGSADSNTVTVVGDLTPPVITPNVSGTLGSNGWYISNVNVSWSVTEDPDSSVTSSTGCGTTSITTDTTGTTLTCSATSAGGTASQSVTIKRDASGPTAGLSVTAGTAGANGWYTSDVTVSTSGSDPISGPVTCTPIQTQTTETSGAAFNGSCTNAAGLTTNAAPFTVKLDKTGPSATLMVTGGTAGANGWYTSDVTVSTSGGDSISGPVVCTADQLQAVETAGAIFTGSCTNDAGLTTNASALTVKLDKTVPTGVALAVTNGTPGANGWYTSDVTVSTSGTDSISGVTCTPDAVLNSDTPGQVIDGSCTNGAGLTADAAPLTIKLDKTGPTAALAVTAGTAGANGWYTSDVTVSTTGTDSVSSPVTCTADQFQTTETTGTAFNGSCTNDAGLTTDASPLTVKLDMTVPTGVALAVTNGTLGANGWYTSDVTVSTSGTDPISGVTCTSDTVLSTETAGTPVNGSCTNGAGLTTHATALTIKLDKTGPSATLAVSAGSAGANGWYTSDVTVSTTGTDSVSSPVTCTADQFQTAETTGAVFNGSCTNDAGLTTNASALTVRLDTTAPTGVALAVTNGTPGANGWYVSDVTVSTSGTDSISGVTCTPDTVLSTETVGTPVNGSCTNGAGLTAHAVALTIKLDKTGPSATLAVTAGTPGANGWYTSDVTVSTSGTDSISDPVTCTAAQAQTTETTGTAFNGSCTNDAGLTTNATPLNVKLDKTGPTGVALSVTSGTLGTNNWYVTNVTITTSSVDSISAPVTCSGPQSQTTDTTGTAFNGSCINDAGLTTSAAPLTIKRDATAPTLSPSVSPNPVLLNGSATASPAAADPTSGIATATCPAAAASSVGTFSVTCTATDNAGNSNTADASYSVQYAAGGYCLGNAGHQILQPVNADGSSVFKKGSTVPAKFRVCDANGASVGIAGVVTSFRLIQLINGTVADVDEPVISTTPDVVFRWSASDQQWIFNMNTKSLSANTTYLYRITLNDGGAPIDFRFGLR